MPIMGKALAGIALIGTLLTANTAGEVNLQETASTVPKRVSEETVPAHIAFTSNQQLWILDANEKRSQPVQVTKQGSAQIAGWSHDGSWLLYIHYPQGDPYATSGYLWAVNQDGSKAFRVDDKPVREMPKWSPNSLQIAYVTEVTRGEATEKEFVVKEIREGERAELVSRSAADFVDFAWMPDGKQILVSLSADRQRPMKLSLRELTGKESASYPLGAPPSESDGGIYLWAPTGLKVSPDGKQVAYYVLYNSASLSADGVPIQLFDLSRPANKPVQIGTGLSNPEWLTWSADSEQLAFIEGTDRMATHNKQLRVVNRTGDVITETEKEKVALFPAWTSQKPYSLFFTSGTGVPYEYEEQKVMVPGQRIWKRGHNGEIRQETKGSEQTADTFPFPNREGSQLLFVRLTAAETGSLFLQKDGKETELVRHVTGEIGYYANYLPKWVDVYWMKVERR